MDAMSVSPLDLHPEGHSISVAGTSTRSLPVLISVLAGRSKVLVVFDVSQSFVVPSSSAVVAASGAVKDLLLRKEGFLSGFDVSPSLQHTDGSECPATSASVLVFSRVVSVLVASRAILKSLGSWSFRSRGIYLRSWGGAVSKPVVLLSLSLSQISEESDSVFDSFVFVVSFCHVSDKLPEVLQPHPGFLSVSVVSAFSVLETLEERLENSGIFVSQVDHRFFGQSAGQNSEQDYERLHLC